MKKATTTQDVIPTPSTYWAEMWSRSWAFFLCALWQQWQPALATVQHRQSPQVGYVPHLPARTVSMLVESDILRGSRSVYP